MDRPEPGWLIGPTFIFWDKYFGQYFHFFYFWPCYHKSTCWEDIFPEKNARGSYKPTWFWPIHLCMGSSTKHHWLQWIKEQSARHCRSRTYFRLFTPIRLFCATYRGGRFSDKYQPGFLGHFYPEIFPSSPGAKCIFFGARELSTRNGNGTVFIGRKNSMEKNYKYRKWMGWYCKF